MRIRVLDDRLINQIAAGEVVERPASVVKELVENAIDATATRIRVVLRAGGRTLIRVVDDGVGMERDDAVLSLERHATSKIRTAEDLANVLSLGFRGEALPSIASVSRLSLATRPAEATVGTRVSIDGGELLSVEDAGCAAGTEIDVRSLFFNLPVRRGFLRTTGTELGHCVEAVARQAMNRPAVAFELFHEERQILSLMATGDRRQRVCDLLGARGSALVPVGFEAGDLTVSGFVSPVGVHRSTRTGSQYLFVNGRFVRDAVVQRAITEAYRGLVPKGRYPMAVLQIAIEPNLVDVNVHPAKVEVRFRHPRDVMRLLASGVRKALDAHNARPARTDEPWLPPGAGAPLPPGAPLPGALDPPDLPWPPVLPKQPSIPPHPSDDTRFAPLAAEAEPTLAVGPAPAAEQPQRFRDLRVIGHLGTAYAVCDDHGDLVVVDLVAARMLVRSVHGGGEPSEVEMRSLLAALDELPDPSAARSLSIRIGRGELSGRFGRP